MMAKAMGRAEQNALKAQRQKVGLKSEEVKVVEKKEEEEKEDDEKEENDEELEAKARKLVDFALVFTVNYCVSIIVQNLFNTFAVHVFKFDSYGWFFGFAVVASILGIGVVISSIVHGVRGHLKVM